MYLCDYCYVSETEREIKIIVIGKVAVLTGINGGGLGCVCGGGGKRRVDD
jgi:hypothetical protein